MEKQVVYIGVGVALLLSVFFIAGFLAADSMRSSSESAPRDAASPEEASSRPTVSEDEAVAAATTYMQNGPLSYPFTTNISTESVTKQTVGDATYYAWNLSYHVEANPFNAPIYQVPGNQSAGRQSLQVFIAGDGTHLFQSPPVSIQRGP